MSDLPTPKEMMNDRPWIGDELEVVIVEAYASGRLVDREAIDYEAAEAIVRKYPRNPTQSASLGEPIGWGATIREIVDAALRVG